MLNDKKKFEGFKEKPNYNFLLNTGLYLINKKELKFLKKNQKLDMDDFIKYRDSSVVEPQEKRIYNSNLNYYEIKFSNVGGLVMPIILELQYEDSTNYIIRILMFFFIIFLPEDISLKNHLYSP